MKTKSKIMVFMSLLLCMGSKVKADEISLQVVEESGGAIPNADVLISYTRARKGTSKVHEGHTNEDGRFRADGKIVMGAFVKVKKIGYYEFVRRTGFRAGSHNVTVALRKIKKPIPLVVREARLEFPVDGEWLGFDFEAGDWVAPHGKGKSRDVLLKFSKEYVGNKYSGRDLEEALQMSKRIAKERNKTWDEADFKIRTAKWDSKLSIGFASDLEGIVEEKGRYLVHSKMKMSHKAPEGGYQGEKEYEQTSYEASKFEMGVGYFIRTRVTEVDDKIIKANYAKIGKDIKVNARGGIAFTYYFNPVVNDRNLEYLPKSNLATEQRRFYDP